MPIDDQPHRYQLAQAGRLIRFLNESGIDLDDVNAGRVNPPNLDLILDESGKIVPEAEDFDGIR